MNPAVLLAFFSPSLPDPCPFLQQVESLPVPVFAACLSPKSAEVPSVSRILSQMAHSGFSPLFVQPMGLLAGENFQCLCSQVSALGRKLNEPVQIGRPLLSEEEDQKAIVRILSRLPRSDGEALVLIGHGTANPSGAAYPALQAMGETMGIPHWYVSTLRDREALLTLLQRDGIRRALLVPLFLSFGFHARRDLSNRLSDFLQQNGILTRCHPAGLLDNRDICTLLKGHLRQDLEALPSITL